MSEETKEETSEQEKDSSNWMMGGGLTDGDMEGDYTPTFTRRFWMPQGSEKYVVFLTEGNVAPIVFEHQVQLGGDWKNWFSCLEPLGLKCGLCEYAEDNNGRFKRYKAMMMTIIDTSEYKDRTGKIWKDQKCLMACKKDTQEILKLKYLDRLEEDEGMRGAMFRVIRTNSDKSCNVGEDFTFKKMVDGEQFDDIEPFDIAEVCAPNEEAVAKTVSRLTREKGGAKAASGFGAGGGKVKY